MKCMVTHGICINISLKNIHADQVQFDSKQIRVFNIDIETAAENGFPDIENTDQEILANQLKDSHTGRIIVFGARPFR